MCAARPRCPFCYSRRFYPLPFPHPPIHTGDRLASGCGDGCIYLWSTVDGAGVGVLAGHLGPVCALAALASGLLASGGADRTIRVWSTADGACACVALLEGLGGRVHALAALPDGRFASGAAGDALVRVWALEGYTAGCEEDACAEDAAWRPVEVEPAP